MVEQGVWQTCVHEASHGLMAREYDWPVVDLRCDAAREGVCHLITPMQPLEMPPRFRAAPLQARKELVQIVSMIIAPSIVLGVEHSAGDQGDLWTWEYVWNKCRYSSYHGSPWDTIYGEAEDAVHTWLQRPGTAECLERVAQELARRRVLSAEDFKKLVSPSDPARPAPAPPRRTPAPTPVAVATRPAAPRSTANGGVAPQPQKRQPQPLEPEDVLWDYYHSYGRGRGFRW
jgi:hypothetical protein